VAGGVAAGVVLAAAIGIGLAECTEPERPDMSMEISVGNVITILTILVSFGVGWGVLQQQLKDHERRIKRHTDQLAAADVCLLEIKVKLAEIARDILYIREQMGREGR
jgi:uncharacterized transporter YbjL